MMTWVFGPVLGPVIGPIGKCNTSFFDSLSRANPDLKKSAAGGYLTEAK